MSYQTKQEEFWAGEFGDQYINRNQQERILASSIALFSEILKKTSNISSVIEFGANIGVNLDAIKLLLPDAEFAAIEINQTAADYLREKQWVKVFQESILTCPQTSLYDIVVIRGVLIHINPDVLDGVYQKLYDFSQKYILIAEYYNPSPVAIEYRGHQDRLFKRDFAGDMLDKFPDLKLLDYGFVYRRDPNFPQDDITWFLLEKNNKKTEA
ncbi:MAG: pseudaminic acid biosynthesis-associated methylase [Firmicutes bacterium HGW-Firmicutes-1]|nr:MAG: pseudaminic acid biosynthesis-associated methylase [Firmicutes bacterium HGW-Firmicutes-1]